MLTNKSGLFPVVPTILLALFLSMGIAGKSLAISDQPTATEMLTQAISLLQQKQYDDALDAMSAYLDAVRDAKLPRMLKKSQDVRYRMAVILCDSKLKLKRTDEDRKGQAISVLQDYISKQPAPHMRRAKKMLVACYYDTDAYEDAIKAAKAALDYNENPVVVAVSKDLKDDETFGDEAEEAEDAPYTSEELTTIHYIIGDSYFKLGDAFFSTANSHMKKEKADEDMEACIEPFTFVSEHASDQLRKGYALMQIIKALINLEKFDRITAWVPQLYKTPARYDIRVNLALLKAASTLYQAKEYDSALPLYRMIVPRDQLLQYQEKRLKQLRIDAGLPPDMGEALTPGESLIFGQADASRQAMEETDASSVVQSVSDTNTTEKAAVPRQVQELTQLIGALKEMPPYQDQVNFQMGQLYKNVQRYWEAVRLYDVVSDAEVNAKIKDPDKAPYQRAVYEAVSVLADDLDENKEAEQKAFSFLDTHKEGMYPRLVAYILTRHYQRQKNWASITGLKSYIDSFASTSDVDTTKYDTELYFMQGVAQLMQQHYTNAVTGFKYVMNNYPGTPQEANALFWCGFSYLCLEQPKNGYDCFERYTRDFPSGPLLDEAYYQGGVSLFSLDRLKEAKERFTYVIDQYGTNSTVYPDACTMRGDILGSEGGDALDAAVADYRNAFNAAKKVTQATSATFKMCDIFKADEAHYGSHYIEQAVNLYLAKWGDDSDADIAKALFWLGRVMIQQQRYEQVANTYFQAIMDYGSDLHQEGVDSMIPQLVKICKVYLKGSQRDAIKTRLQVAIDTTKNMTLKLRLQVALAKFDGTELELGKKLIKELPDLNDASPPVLDAICEASFASHDYSRAEELLRIFKYQFETSPYMRSAYKLRASGQIYHKDYEGALKTIQEAQEEYGTAPDVAWAQLMKAQVLLALGKIDDAREANKNVMIPEWRGEPYAQATYQLGQVEEKAGNLLAAHAYYQRAYYQYKGLAGGHWGAEGYLAAARCLKKLADDPSTSEKDRRRYIKARHDTLVAMLYDRYVNQLPQAEEARKILGPSEVAAIDAQLTPGSTTNIVIDVESTESSNETGTTNKNVKAAGDA